MHNDKWHAAVRISTSYIIAVFVASHIPTTYPFPLKLPTHCRFHKVLVSLSYALSQTEQARQLRPDLCSPSFCTLHLFPTQSKIPSLPSYSFSPANVFCIPISSKREIETRNRRCYFPAILSLNHWHHLSYVSSHSILIVHSSPSHRTLDIVRFVSARILFASLALRASWPLGRPPKGRWP